MDSSWRLLSVVEKEMRKLRLTTDEATKVTVLMGRFARGKALPKDHKPLRDGVHELRINCDHRTVRLYFGILAEEATLLALHIHFKKSQTEPGAIDLAAARLKNYIGGTLR